MRLIYPTAGSARILGRPIDDVATRSRIGFLPENPYFYDYLTGRELLVYTAALFGISGSQARQKADELIKVVGLDDEAGGRQLRKYSKGMLQRIGIAQALIGDPEVVFMDEPMSGLDPIGRREVRDLLLSLRSQGKTVFFSSHILSDVEALCDRAAILMRGKLFRCGSVQELSGNQERSIEIVAIGVDREALDALLQAERFPALSLTSAPAGVQMVVRHEKDVDQALQLIRRSGGKLVSVNPRRTSLEDAFFAAEQR
jgi:ABC-2 type transport system ATP-binding protein